VSPTISNRRLLVIGSQCEALGEGYRLTFLPPAAEELYKVLIDPDFGRCHPVQPDRGLLIDPTVAAVKTAIREAFRLASDDGSTLLLVFIGHGTYVGNDYFFLPLDAASAPDPDTGIHVVQQIDYAYRAHPSIDGLVLLVDTCNSGLAAERAAAQWVGEYRRGEEAARKLRFEILTASAPDREAWNGCFTREVTHCLRQGLDDVPTEELRCQDVERIVRRECMRDQLPQFLAFTPSVPVASDAGLWLGCPVCAHFVHYTSRRNRVPPRRGFRVEVQ
jgi:Caspase domain